MIGVQEAIRQEATKLLTGTEYAVDRVDTHRVDRTGETQYEFWLVVVGPNGVEHFLRFTGDAWPAWMDGRLPSVVGVELEQLLRSLKGDD